MFNTSQVLNSQQLQHLFIQEASYKQDQIYYSSGEQIFTAAISDNLKYIIAGGSDKLLKIWNYKTKDLIKSIKFDSNVNACKFTADSQLLYIGMHNILYQFYVKNHFKKVCRWERHSGEIINIICITQTIILTSSNDNTIHKADIIKKQLQLKIQANQNKDIYGLDYNKKLNIIACVSIRLWSGKDGSLIMEKLYSNDNTIKQVLFITNTISLDLSQNLIKWNIKFHTKQLEQLQIIKNSGYNISLVLQQQYIIAIGKKFIKIHTINGESIRKLNHQFDNFRWFNTIQNDSMKAILIQGLFELQVCKLEKVYIKQ